jgi:hypothetical protein
VLWHTAVEGRQPKELAGVLGVSANAAAAMAYRAREKLRQAYLQAHLLASPAPEHEPYRSQLGAYVRDGLSKRDRAAVQAHLDGCKSCRALVAELDDVNRMLVRSVVPLFVLVGGGKAALAAAAGGAAAGGAAAESGSSGSSGGSPSLASKARSLASPVGSVVAIGALIAGLAGIGTVMAREDDGPLNQAADAANIGSFGSDGSGRVGDGDGDGSVFGDDDFALGPFDDSAIDDFGTFGGDDFDFDSRSSRPRAIPRSGTSRGSFPGPGSGSGSGSGTGASGGTGGTGPGPSAPVDPGAPPPTPPASLPPTPPPGPSPVEPPAEPAPLGFGTISWTPHAPGTGTLSLTIGERGAALASATALAAPLSDVASGQAAVTQVSTAAADAPLKLHLELTPGARVADEGPTDRCSAPVDLPAGGQTLDCAFDQPPAGGAVPTFDIPLTVDRPGAEATASVVRGDAVEDTRVVALPDFASRLSVTAGWQPAGDGATGTLTLTVLQGGDWPVGDLAVQIGLTGGAGPDPLRPLPAGCTAADRGQDHGVSCTLDGVAGASRTDLPVPLAVTGEGQKATVRVLFGTTPIGDEVTVALPSGQPPDD